MYAYLNAETFPLKTAFASCDWRRMGLETQSINSSLQEDVKEHIKTLSTQLVDSLNTRSFGSKAEELLLPTFSGYHDMDDTSWTAKTRGHIKNQMEQFLIENPNFHTEITDISIDGDDKDGVASAWIVRTDTGLVEGPDRETIMELSWMRRGSEWFVR